MIKWQRGVQGAMVLMVAVLLTACSGSPRTLYHTLGATAATTTSVPMVKVAVPSLGVGPVRLPALLDRQGVVLRKDAYSVEISELHEWGGELEDEFTRALADRLQIYLADTRIRTVPWELEQTPKYQVTLTVTQFDGTPGQSAMLNGRWQLQLAANGKGIRSGVFKLTQPVLENSVPSLVRAQSQLVDDLAVDILRGFAH